MQSFSMRDNQRWGFREGLSADEMDAETAVPLPGQVIAGQHIVSLLSEMLDRHLQRTDEGT